MHISDGNPILQRKNDCVNYIRVYHRSAMRMRKSVSLRVDYNVTAVWRADLSNAIKVQLEMYGQACL